MPVQTDSLKHRLARASEITITVVGRKSGRETSRPVWFVLEGDDLYLLPVEGSDTQWYQNVMKNPKIEAEAGARKASSKRSRSRSPQKSRRWRTNSGKSMGRETSKNAIRSSTSQCFSR